MKDQVLAEHRRLDVLFAQARDAFLRTDPSGRAVRALKELREALETHFDQEDHLYYPAIWALRPDLKPGLQDFVAEHEKFRSQLETIEAVLDRTDFEGCGRAIEVLAVDFGRHEDGEESMLRSLDLEIENAD